MVKSREEQIAGITILDEDGTGLVNASNSKITNATSIEFGTSKLEKVGNNLILEANAGAGNLNINAANTTISGNLLVSGTTTSINTNTVNVKDTYLALNIGYNAVGINKPSGIVEVKGGVTPIFGTNITQFTGLQTASLANDPGFIFGDIIQIQGASDPENNGIFEFSSWSSGVLTINPASSNNAFLQSTFKVSSLGQTATLQKVSVSVIRAKDPLGQEVGDGYNIPLTFKELAFSEAIIAPTLQSSYEGGNSIITDSLNGSINITGTEGLSASLSGTISLSSLSNPFLASGSSVQLKSNNTTGASSGNLDISTGTTDQTSGDIIISTGVSSGIGYSTNSTLKVYGSGTNSWNGRFESISDNWKMAPNAYLKLNDDIVIGVDAVDSNPSTTNDSIVIGKNAVGNLSSPNTLLGSVVMGYQAAYNNYGGVVSTTAIGFGVAANKNAQLLNDTLIGFNAAGNDYTSNTARVIIGSGAGAGGGGTECVIIGANAVPNASGASTSILIGGNIAPNMFGSGSGILIGAGAFPGSSPYQSLSGFGNSIGMSAGGSFQNAASIDGIHIGVGSFISSTNSPTGITLTKGGSFNSTTFGATAVAVVDNSFNTAVNVSFVSALGSNLAASSSGINSCDLFGDLIFHNTTGVLSNVSAFGRNLGLSTFSGTISNVQLFGSGLNVPAGITSDYSSFQNIIVRSGNNKIALGPAISSIDSEINSQTASTAIYRGQTGSGIGDSASVLDLISKGATNTGNAGIFVGNRNPNTASMVSTVGDLYINSTTGQLWQCVVAGTPGTWDQFSTGGSLNLAKILNNGNTTDGYNINLTAGSKIISSTGNVTIQDNLDVFGDGYVSGDFVIDGKLTVNGLIDPTGLVLDHQITKPFNQTSSKSVLWIKNSDGYLYYNDLAIGGIGLSTWARSLSVGNLSGGVGNNPTLQGNDYLTSNIGSSLKIKTQDGQATSDNIVINTGTPSNGGTSGNINIQALSGTNTLGGNVSLTSGSSSTGTSSNITLTGATALLGGSVDISTGTGVSSGVISLKPGNTTALKVTSNTASTYSGASTGYIVTLGSDGGLQYSPPSSAQKLEVVVPASSDPAPSAATLEANYITYACDVSLGGFTITLPTTTAAGTKVRVKDAHNGTGTQANAQNIIISSTNIDGSSTQTISTIYGSMTLISRGYGNGWMIV